MNIKRNKLTKRALAASLVGVVLSVSLCAGSTVAWFQDTVSNKNAVEIGNFGVNASAALALTRSVTPLSSTATVLPAGFYEVKIGGVGNTPGYAWMGLKATRSDSPREVYATKLLTGGTAYTYELMLNEETAVYVASVWDDVAPENPLEEGTIINYGRPPMPPPSEEKQPEDADGEQSGGTETESSAQSAESASSTESSDNTSADSTSTDSTDSTPTDSTDSTPTDSTDSTPSGGTDSTPTSDADSTPTSDADSTPSGGADSTPTSDADSTPSGGTDSTPTSDADSTPSGSTDSTPGADPE